MIEKKDLALTWALQYSEVYLGSRSRPDENPLIFSNSLPCSNQRLLHWSVWLQVEPLSVGSLVVMLLSFDLFLSNNTTLTYITFIPMHIL